MSDSVKEIITQAVNEGGVYKIRLKTAYQGVELGLQVSRLIINGKDLELSPTESKLFYYFFARIGGVVSRLEIHTQVLGKPEAHLELGNEPAVYVRYLREKLGAYDLCPFKIETVRGEGYRMTYDPKNQ